MYRHRSTRCFTPLAALLAVLTALSVDAFQEDGSPRNFDARIALNQHFVVAPPPIQVEQVERLRASVPELAVSYDGATGVTRTLGARLGTLTGPADGEARAIALDFVAANLDLLGLSQQDVADLEVTAEVVSRVSRTSHFYFRQRAHGLPLYTGELQVHVAADGRILRVSNQFLPDLAGAANIVQPRLDDETAVRLAGASAGLDDEQSRQALRSEPTLMLLAIRRGEARLVWNFRLETPGGQHHYDFNIDAVTGEVWTRVDWVNASEFRVYGQPVESPECAAPLPPADARSLQLDPEHPTASQLGWFDDGTFQARHFQGNNVYAYPDLFGTNSSAIEYVCGLAGDHLCDFPLDLALEPAAYTAAATANLFYWTNVVHDIQYLYGFDEAGGNFQQDNFGNGGVGGDRLDAESQDASTSIFGFPIECNASMFTPPDGASPRMQAWTCTLSTPGRDAALDNGVVVHEYGHGISMRQVGGPATTSCLANDQQMGEGISDWLALVYTAETDDLGADARGLGTYLFGESCDGAGIRAAPYSTDFAVNGYTYADIATQVVPHGVGFVWATAAWEAYWALVDIHGFDADLYNVNGGAGNQRAMLYHSEALQTVNCHPTFIDLRDAIIAAAEASDPADVCPIWEAFARRGLGAAASTIGRDDLNPVEDFTVPVSCAEFTLEPPSPGSAGVVNGLGFIGATALEDVYVVAGTAAGTSSVNVPGCGAVTVDVAGSTVHVAQATADVDGAGTVSRLIPAGQAGQQVGFQAVDAAICATSNRVVHTF